MPNLSFRTASIVTSGEMTANPEDLAWNHECHAMALAAYSGRLEAACVSPSSIEVVSTNVVPTLPHANTGKQLLVYMSLVTYLGETVVPVDEPDVIVDEPRYTVKNGVIQ